MAHGDIDKLGNAIIDGGTDLFGNVIVVAGGIVIVAKPGKPFPRPKSTGVVEYDQEQFNQIDTLVCKNTLKGARGQGDCEVYGRIVNKYIDGNLACKWGSQLESTVKTTKDVTSELAKAGTMIEQQSGGSVFGLIGTGLKGVSNIIGASAGTPGCNVYALGLPETIDSIYAPVPPPAPVPSPATAPGISIPAAQMIGKNARITGRRRPAR